MEAGATLGRRFVLRSSEDHDLPGVDRWVARDGRRDVDVTVDIITSLAPSAVRRAAVRAAQVRDARFARVLASGRETVGDERVTYVVSERPTGVSVTELVGRRIVPARLAGSIVGEAARALMAAAVNGSHHGYLRASALTVTAAGRVVVSGLDAEGELASQAGRGRGHSEAADAVALARLHLALVTGMDPDAVTAADVPSSLPPAAHDLALSTVAGTAPRTLEQIARAVGPADATALRSLRTGLRSLPLAPGSLETVPQPTPLSRIVLSPTTLASAAHEAAAAIAANLSAPEVASEVRADRVDTTAVELQQTTDGYIPTPPEVAAQYSKRTRRAAARDADEPLGLETWQEIVVEQNPGPPRSAAQIALEWFERRMPSSVAIGAAADQARHRAVRPAPLRAGPVVVGAFMAITIVVGIVAFQNLVTPLEPDPNRTTRPPVSYPEFTFSPSPSPTVTEGD